MNAKEKLQFFHERGQTPNLIIHGGSGGGKMTIVRWFVNLLYKDNKAHMADYVMYVNCAFDKGIKFIRENLKYFAKTNIHLPGMFKVIVLNNADQLTGDAQSALRRCIEQFSFNTRFLMVTTEKCKLLKPIISRFAEVYVPARENLHIRTVGNAFPMDFSRTSELDAILASDAPLVEKVDQLYSRAFSALDVARGRGCAWQLRFSKLRGEYRNERLLLFTVLSPSFS